MSVTWEVSQSLMWPYLNEQHLSCGSVGGTGASSSSRHALREANPPVSQVECCIVPCEVEPESGCLLLFGLCLVPAPFLDRGAEGVVVESHPLRLSVSREGKKKMREIERTYRWIDAIIKRSTERGRTLTGAAFLACPVAVELLMISAALSPPPPPAAAPC